MDTRKKIRNYDLLSTYNYFIPRPAEVFALLLFLLAGSLIGNIVTIGLLLLMPGTTQDLTLLIVYPIMFIPPMIYSSIRSQRNAMFDNGCAIDGNAHLGKPGIAGTGAMVMLATLALAFLMDIINSQMPPMPEWLENMMNGMTQGNFIINFICVSIFAPFFEEWLCRGMVLRGLLNYKRKDGSKGMKPVWAIIISALFFAFIHLNPWQAIPAFALGCLFGYVYYRTGSLKLTMLMHFTNNTFALIISNLDTLKDTDNWLQVLPVWQYCIVAVICFAYLWIFIRTLNRIELASPSGNCDEITVQ